jgi:hypothetical protein
MPRKSRNSAEDEMRKKENVSIETFSQFLSTSLSLIIERPKPVRIIKTMPLTIIAGIALAYLKCTAPPAIALKKPEVNNTPITAFIFFILSPLIFKACLILS